LRSGKLYLGTVKWGDSGQFLMLFVDNTVKTFFDRIEDLNIINMNLETPFELLKPRFWDKEVFF